MRIKILMFGTDPSALLADEQLLKDRGMLVVTSFNMENINEMITEVKPDLIFFDAREPNTLITQAYNDTVNSISYTRIPVVFTLSEDDVYLVTRKRTDLKEKRSFIADNIIDAVKMALNVNKTSGRQHKKTDAPAEPRQPNSKQYQLPWA